MATMIRDDVATTQKARDEYGLVQFEEGYIFRNNRAITSTPDIALTEFVANAWDAGAFHVNIIIPTEEGDVISVEDDGTGMSDEEFRQRWMTLNYDRQKRQGKEVVFPAGTQAYRRIAYGRNGIGRHGMLCYAFLITIQLKRGKTVCVINTILLFHLVRNLLKFLTVSNIPKRDTEQKSAHTFTAICQIQKL